MMISFDTNILVYATLSALLAKIDRARDPLVRGMRTGSSILLLQTPAECSSVAIRKAGIEVKNPQGPGTEMTLRYPVKLEADDNGTVLATCPSLPEMTTFGENDADALAHAVGAIEEALAARIADGGDIPAPRERLRGRSVALPLMTSLKVSLYRALRESGITRAELMRRLGWNRESVDRLFRLDHASRLDQIEAAFRALGKSVALEVEEAGR
jgi:antitoxin HicB